MTLPNKGPLLPETLTISLQPFFVQKLQRPVLVGLALMVSIQDGATKAVNRKMRPVQDKMRLKNPY